MKSTGANQLEIGWESIGNQLEERENLRHLCRGEFASLRIAENLPDSGGRPRHQPSQVSAALLGFSDSRQQYRNWGRSRIMTTQYATDPREGVYQYVQARDRKCFYVSATRCPNCRNWDLLRMITTQDLPEKHPAGVSRESIANQLVLRS